MSGRASLLRRPGQRSRRRPSVRRHAWQAACNNAALWGIGGGLANLTLIAYFASALGASATQLGWVLAAPAAAGLLRLAAPLAIPRFGGRRRAAVIMFLASAAFLAAAPVAAGMFALPWGKPSLAGLAAMWTLSQVCEQLGVVALWAWLGEHAPPRVRGRLVAWREQWLVAGLVIGTIAGVTIAETASRLAPLDEADFALRAAYAASAWWGAAFIAASAAPLLKAPDATRPNSTTAPAPRLAWRDLWQPWHDRGFRSLLLFGLWYSVANGLVQSVQQQCLIQALRFSYPFKKSLDTASRALQLGLLPLAGRAADRRGGGRLLTASWFVVSLAAFCFVAATPATWWWILVAYGCWLAYAGVNVALPQLMLDLSSAATRERYAAAWFAWTQLAYAASLPAGGWLFDRWVRSSGSVPPSTRQYALFFLANGLLKLAGVPLARRIKTPVLADGASPHQGPWPSAAAALGARRPD